MSMGKNRYGEFSGRLNLTIKNNSQVPGRLRLLFIPANAGRALNLGREGEGEFVRRIRPPAKRLRLRAGDLLYVRLALRVPSRASLSSVDGILVAQLRPAEKGSASVPSADLRIAGKPRQTKDVLFEPAEVAIAPSRFCRIPSLGTCHTEAEITLRGDGARRLLVDNREPDARGILHNGSGETVAAVLGDVTEDENGVVTGTVKLSDIEHVGEYKGVLAITPGGQGAPQMPITVSVGNSFFWAFLAVLAGAGLAYIIRWRDQIGQQRKRLQSRLDVAVRRYERILREYGEAPASFDLKRDIGPPPWDKPILGEEGIAGLRHRINEAQQGAFAELSTEVDETVLTICRWVEVERAVHHAREEMDKPVPELDGHEIDQSKCRDGLETLIDRASSDTVLAECKLYLGNLERHLRLYMELRDVWQQKDAILCEDGLTGAQKVELGKIHVWEADADLPELAKRQPEDFEQVHSRLRKMGRHLRKISGALPEHEHRSKHLLRRTRDWETEFTAKLRKEREGREFGLRWRQRGAWLNLHDAFWAFVAIAIASIGYAVTFYNDTWGSKVDFFTAIATGFGVKFGADAAQQVDWTNVPIVGSLMAGVTGAVEPPPAPGPPVPEPDTKEQSAPAPDPSSNGGGEGNQGPGHSPPAEREPQRS